MTEKLKRRVAAVFGDGHIRLMEQDLPELCPGAVLIEVCASLVSPGTEFGGWRALASRRASPKADAEPSPFGYSNAGVVSAVGEGVERFSPGDRVAAIGAGYAYHTDWAVVPQNLCVLLPKEVTYEQASYGMLLATALHAVRRGQPELGEYVAVAGLGVVGQLTAQVHRLAGNYVIGWDSIRFRVEVARKWGIDAAVVVEEEDESAATKAFTRGEGLDACVLALGGPGDTVVRHLAQCMKRTPDGHRMGRMVVVGGATFDYGSVELPDQTNIDIRRASRTGFGYHDNAWEYGQDYPPVAMRWTTRTNLELCMRLIAEGKVNVDALTTHRIPLSDIDADTSDALRDPDRMLGVIFAMKE